MNQAEMRKLPPQSIEAEMSILGGILVDNEAINRVLEVLTPEEMYRESHRKIMRAMIELNERGEPCDLITMTTILRKKGELEEVGGGAYLATLVDFVPMAANISYYCKIVKEKYITRKLISAATDIVSNGFEDKVEVEELLDSAQKVIFEISENKLRPSYYKVSDILKDTIKNIELLYEKKELVTGVPTGYTDLDKLTAGFHAGDLVIIAGRPAMGKTTFALNVAQYASVDSEKKFPAAIFSLEMPKEQLVERLLCSASRVDLTRLRSGHLQENDWPKLIKGAGLLHNSKIFIDDTPSITVMELRSKARRLKAEHDIGIIVIDYLQLMRGGANSESRQQEISEISRSLKALAKELSIPVIALSQLNRSLEQRTDKRPMMSDLRESGAIEQDADIIMFVYRGEVYDKENEDLKGKAEVIIGKHRSGPIGTVDLAFRGEFTRFENLSSREEY
ncbi:replicative DNA helicase [Geomonas sp. Red69]|uniref:Replicative DNA helicase n=1 Tax=Geomonas diazotrophica TaxID=2843197 RepID=A0ABX8JTT0_9BACT|nr:MULTISPECIES: replicative DNA helicase [Geomonas]MBU5636934.1 replicative DNA helicase [Geomonas diazotrophica]QWV98835.1 replicative DNA helicase [Geomonas nitrogeniifigens]QXE87982.1 replicative DNA helicase [Geomonas nitrogeniifigens]